ncbi:hypothetical protein [Burkholderia sp. 22313]|uniref:hypothetical protein n=1 Tax=Burkholderia sp. 22313 TaxID=3453908 RepID=UPI003F848F62
MHAATGMPDAGGSGAQFATGPRRVLVVDDYRDAALNNARSNREQATVFKEQPDVLCGKLEAVEPVTSMVNTTFSKISAKLAVRAQLAAQDDVPPNRT